MSMENSDVVPALILDVDVVVLEKLHPSRLAASKMGLSGEVLKGIVVSDAKNRWAFKVVSPYT